METFSVGTGRTCTCTYRYSRGRTVSTCAYGRGAHVHTGGHVRIERTEMVILYTYHPIESDGSIKSKKLVHFKTVKCICAQFAVLLNTII